MMTPTDLAEILRVHPYPDSNASLRLGDPNNPADYDVLTLRVANRILTYHRLGWSERQGPVAGVIAFAAAPARVHHEIRQALAVLDRPPATPAIPTLEELAAEPPIEEDDLYDRATAEQALAKVTAERDDLERRLAAVRSDRHEETLRWANEREALRAEVKRITDAHAVVSQRFVGAQKEVAERDATIDELRGALESIAANVGLIGSDQWAVGEIVVKVGEATARTDKVEDRLCRDDEMREQIAVAVGLDGSASLALILDTVTRDRPGREISRLSGLLDVLAAPVAFGERRLSTAERAEWALRRWLAEGKASDARIAQLIEAEVYLDVLGVPAYAAVPSDDPGDASEALTVAERLRLYFGAQS